MKYVVIYSTAGNVRFKYFDDLKAAVGWKLVTGGALLKNLEYTLDEVEGTQ